MPRRLSRRYLEARFTVIAAAMGWRLGPKGTRFSVYLAMLPAPDTRWIVVRVLNDAGQTEALCRPYFPAEMDAWLAGVLVGKRESC